MSEIEQKGNQMYYIGNYVVYLYIILYESLQREISIFSNYHADVESGVPQGTILGLLLFLLHINDLPSGVNSKVRLFADDCLLYIEIIIKTKSKLTCKAQQRDLDTLMDWGMKFNAKKCNIMRVSRFRKPLQHFYNLGNELLQD